jgi:deoxycytidine triphosphate deaminase
MILKVYIDRKHPLLDMGILADRGIRKAIKDKKILLQTKLDDNQFQPNSLDLRLKSAELFHVESKSEFEIETVQEIINLKKNQAFDLPRNTYTSLYFKEKLITDYIMRVDERSGRARRGIMNPSDCVYIDNKGNANINIFNTGKNPIRLYGHDRIAHAFFYTPKAEGDGYVVSNENELKDIAGKLNSKITVDAPYLVFNTGEFALIQKEAEIDDTRGNQSLFEKVELEGKKVFKENHIVVQLSPEVNVPSNVAIQLLPRIPYTNEIYKDKNALYHLMHSFVVKGGWVESGYRGNLTAHISIFNDFFSLKRGEPLVYALAYKYYNDVERAYGSSGLDSHYQKSTGDKIKS